MVSAFYLLVFQQNYTKTIRWMEDGSPHLVYVWLQMEIQIQEFFSHFLKNSFFGFLVNVSSNNAWISAKNIRHI